MSTIDGGPGNIVTKNLVLYLDAANIRSYPKTGTTWSDLAGSNNGTLTNGPTFNSANGGSIVIDEVDDFIALPKLSLTTSLTFNVFVNISSFFSGGVNPGFWRDGSNSRGNNFNILQSTTGRPWIRWNGVNILRPLSGYGVPLNNWIYVSYVVENGGPNVYFYVNGDLKHSNTHTSTITSIDIYNIGYQYSISEKLPGQYGIISVYNRALSATEVLQNFNATRARFGI